MTDRVRRTRRVIEATAPRWTFEGGIRDAARQALVVLRHEEDDQLEHSQYRHFSSRAREGDDAEVVPARGRDHVGCLPDQVKLTSALIVMLMSNLDLCLSVGALGGLSHNCTLSTILLIKI
jgi:hypothetical protein